MRGMIRPAVETVHAPSYDTPSARFSLGGSEFFVVPCGERQPYPDNMLGTFTAGGRRYAVLARAGVGSGPDLIDLLTPRELEIACLIASGCECKEIARRLRISFHTVRVHLGRTYGKLGLHKQTELAARIAA